MKHIASIITLLLVVVCEILIANARAETNTVEGISGDIDKKRRGPSLSVNAFAEGSGAKILADAYVPNKEFAEYPIRFDFYINRRLFSSQIRTKELPGAVGVDVGSDIASIPFNYSVVATLLHPNRQFITTAYGVVYSSNLVGTLDCTLSVLDAAGDSADFSALEVKTVQSGNDTLSINFIAENSSDDTEVNVTSSLSISSDQASGSLSYSIENEAAKALSVSGSVTKGSSQELTSISLASSDDSLTLDCE